MQDSDKTKAQLIHELSQLRQRLAELEENSREPNASRQARDDTPLQHVTAESRRLEEQILAAAQAWRATFDAIHDAVWVLDTESTVTRCNQKMADLVGRPFGDIIGQPCHNLIHHSPVPIAACPAQRAKQTLRRETTTMPVGDRWFRCVADPVLDEKGHVTGIVHIMSDISERRRADEALRRRNHELTLLNQAARACSSTLKPTEVLFTVLEETCHLLDVVSSSVWLIDPETNEMVCQHATGSNRETLRNWRLPMGEGIVGQVAATGNALIVPDTRTDERHYMGVDQTTGLELLSIVGVPLKIKQQVVGVLEVVDSKLDRFSTADLRLLEPLAVTAATAIENARLYERAQREIADRTRAEAEREKMIVKLQEALAKVSTLSGLLPMCANCKKIRDDQGYWQQVEVYIREHSEADFSHGLCPDCAKRLYPDIFTDEDF
jgi:PAS domain S-box-containing protein